jgi:hypothetical protein
MKEDPVEDLLKTLLEDLMKDNYVKHTFGKRIEKALKKLDETGGADPATLEAALAAQTAIATVVKRLGGGAKAPSKSPKPATADDVKRAAKPPAEAGGAGRAPRAAAK